MSMQSIRFALCVFTLCGLNAFPARAEPPATLEPSLADRSVVDMGDAARLQHVLAKARRGEKVVVGVIGGSITAGACASSEEKRWGNRVAAWWKQAFPRTDIGFVNAGIGATGSDIGSHRAKIHLFNRLPDLVVIEFAVNDPDAPIASETLEGLIRQALGQPNKPAVMLLFMMTKTGSNAQNRHIPIGRHYGLAMVSFRDALWPEVQNKRIAWNDIEADEVHPNDRGHQYAADCVTRVIQEVKAKLPADDRLSEIKPIPAPKISDTFQRTAFFNAETIRPQRNEGWQPLKDHPFAGLFGPGWKATAPGSVLEFDVEGSAVGVIFYRIKGGMGIAEAWVDDARPVKMDAWFSADWGGYTPYQLVARDLKAGHHILRIRVLDEKNPSSTGNEFRLHAVMSAGVVSQTNR